MGVLRKEQEGRDDLPSFFCKKEVYRFEGQSKEKILMRNRDINNKITILETVAPSFIKQEDITFMRGTQQSTACLPAHIVCAIVTATGITLSTLLRS